MWQFIVPSSSWSWYHQQRWRLNDSETETASPNVITAEVEIGGRISPPSNKYGTENGWDGRRGSWISRAIWRCWKPYNCSGEQVSPVTCIHSSSTTHSPLWCSSATRSRPYSYISTQCMKWEGESREGREGNAKRRKITSSYAAVWLWQKPRRFLRNEYVTNISRFDSSRSTSEGRTCLQLAARAAAPPHSALARPVSFLGG